MSSEPNKSDESIPTDPPRDDTAAAAQIAEDGDHPTLETPGDGEPLVEGGAEGAAEGPDSASVADVSDEPVGSEKPTVGGVPNEDDEVQPIDEAPEEEEKEPEFHWYILKVQVNREKSICEALNRRVKIEALEDMFREVVVPTEDVAEFNKAGKRRIVKKKLYPGYIMVNMAINDDTWFLIRETPGIGDFTGSAGKPTPMDPGEVERIISSGKTEEGDEGQIKTSIPFKSGDHVRVKDGNFQGFEGDVDAIDEAHGRVTVMINIFGRPTPVELEHWQIESV